ncbi:TIGR03668 family PPOX class F420-dependent oxidoreductase [Nocardia seriolae]|uniref:TIGR03668 family PPOX class F420-dependent oxidoreductase n=1 Tax=Nocardia seriolae TaxID=37332 RepID=UPI0003F3FA51|nr:TIGR03668 family PPOX class F420-dependent oxidoreductase [Nocardia seriolae]MTJ64843.1 TIGR03668 family PPOX class F420-dependent oxidoreductase [Nocardia seriolae]MTJ64844.1 TIGR03668 family PPOX class F420-dependent oxidoreductase [Nocardia seriolae]MTJ72378.1 TIGR03668 family PPOX class F420-dependent oxidoreductase [Nocardia seriolae]MTJ89678.1 TIGR03668 family PPOX class F420-dependent oxidoreductase [Nocardia seriolae]MTK33653.1 TIGR03668 family PPOX class F420-dependent oxidoreducta
MRSDADTALSRFRAARVARLATADATGQPHLVPVTFAVSPSATPLFVVIAIDHKPKSTTDLRRLRNIAANPRVSLLADHYDEDWTRLWWARLDGVAEILTAPAELDAPLAWLSEKYPQYRATPPTGPLIRIEVESIRGWAYSG